MSLHVKGLNTQIIVFINVQRQCLLRVYSHKYVQTFALTACLPITAIRVVVNPEGSAPIFSDLVAFETLKGHINGRSYCTDTCTYESVFMLNNNYCLSTNERSITANTKYFVGPGPISTQSQLRHHSINLCDRLGK